jgi:hypothetical protein
LGGGLCCGLLWETWNYWAGAKWVYTVPFVGFLKVFEMPILGFVGFLPFSLEAYVMTNSAFVLFEGIKRRKAVSHRFALWLAVSVCFILFCHLMFMGIDRRTVVTFRP